MKNQGKIICRILSFLLTFSILISVFEATQFIASASQTTTYVHDGYKIDYIINNTNTWNNSQGIQVVITNTGTETIENWMLAYSDFCGEIQGLWNASIAQTETGLEYMRNVAHNSVIPPNQSVNFGYTLHDYTGIPETITMCQENSAKLNGFTAELNITNDWGSAFNGEIILTNNTDEPIESWEITFSSNFTITSITTSWAASFADNGGGDYTFKGTDTRIIQPNSNVILGFQANKSTYPEITDIRMTEVAANEFIVYWTMFGEAQSDGYWLYGVNHSDQTAIILGFATENYEPNAIIPDEIDGFPVTRIGYGAFTDTAVTSVTLPESVTNIGNFAFEKCTELTEITLPDGVTKIENAAFYSSGLKTVTIGAGVTEIGMAVFADCPSLESVVFKLNAPPMLDSLVFGGSNKLTTIYVPVGSKSAFRAEPQLSKFKYVELDSDGNPVPCVDECKKLVCVCEYVPIEIDYDDSGYVYDGNDIEYRVTAEAVYAPSSESVMISWNSAASSRSGESFVPDARKGKFEVFYRDFDTEEYQSLGTLEDEFSYVHQTDGEDFIVQYYKIVQSVGGKVVAESNVCYAVWSPAGVDWMEYNREWKSDNGGINLSKINENNLVYQLSVEFSAAGIPDLHFSGARSRFSNAIGNEAVIGTAPELIYRSGLTADSVAVEFEIIDETINVENMNIFRYFENINMLLPVATNIDQANNILYTDSADFGTYCLVDMEKWTDLLDSNEILLGLNWSMLDLDAPLIKNGETDTDGDGLTDWEEIDSALLEQFWAESGIVPPSDGDSITDTHLPTLDYLLGKVSDFDVSALIQDVKVIPVKSNPMAESTANDGILDLDKVRILPEHDDICDRGAYENVIVVERLDYGMGYVTVCNEDCKPGILERYYNDGTLKYNNVIDIDFFIDYKHYIGRLRGSNSNEGIVRYLSENDTKMNPFISYTAESMFPELTSSNNINNINNRTYYEIKENTVRLYVGVEFTSTEDYEDIQYDKILLPCEKCIGCRVCLGDVSNCNSCVSCGIDCEIEVTRRQMVARGILEHWSMSDFGSVYDFFPGMKIDVEVIVQEKTEGEFIKDSLLIESDYNEYTLINDIEFEKFFPSNKQTLKVRCEDRGGSSYYNGESIRIARSWGRVGDSDFSAFHYMMMAKHEFGHALGLADYAWNFVIYQKNEVSSPGGMSGDGIPELNDIEMAFHSIIDGTNETYIPLANKDMSKAIREIQTYRFIGSNSHYIQNIEYVWWENKSFIPLRATVKVGNGFKYFDGYLGGVEILGLADDNVADSIIIPTHINDSPVTRINGCAFYGENFNSVVINDSVTSIGPGAFWGCVNLTDINIPNGIRIIREYTFRGCSSLGEIVIPDLVRIIGHNAFSECTLLKRVIVPDNVTDMDSGVFYNCPQLRSVTFGINVKNLNYYAFLWGSIELRSVVFRSSELQSNPKFGDGFFQGCSKLKKIYIPIDSGEKYKAALNSDDLRSKVEEVQFDEITGEPYKIVENDVRIDFCTELNCMVLEDICECDNCDFDRHTAGSDATCTESQICTVCDVELKPALGHTAGSDATCTEPQNCTVCEEEIESELGHVPGTAATCASSQICIVCNDELAPSLGHDESGRPANCTTRQVCARSGCSFVVKPPLGHDSSGAKATCLEPQICARSDCSYITAPAGDNCDTCREKRPPNSFKLGDVDGNGKIEINDAVEILRYNVFLPSFIAWCGCGKECENLESCSNARKCELSFKASLIVGKDEPSEFDITEIQKYLVQRPSKLDEVWGRVS